MTQHALLELQHQIYREAQSSSWPLPELLPWVVDPRNLQAAWTRIRDADGAKTPGPDGHSVLDWESRQPQLLRQVTGRLFNGTFRPSAPRLVEMPKPDGRGTRTLAILNVRDRLIHAALKQVLEPILDPLFTNDSFGFRPGRAVPGALVTATRLLSSRGSETSFGYVVKVDVHRCFDTIDHASLRDKLAGITSNEDTLRLLDVIFRVSGQVVSNPPGQDRPGTGRSRSPLVGRGSAPAGSLGDGSARIRLLRAGRQGRAHD